MTLSNKTAALLAMTALAAGLASCAQKEAYSSQAPSAAADGAGPKVVEATPRVQRDDSSEPDTRSDRDNILNERLVFFDFDKSVVLPEFGAMLTAHTDFLVVNRDKAVVLQGHADERGSTEYNLALGQRRSDAVAEVLISGGVFPDQVETISYGEERPRALGSNEAAWAENRRVEIIYTDE